MGLNIAGRYEFVSADKYEDYLKAIGVGAVTRTIAGKISSTMEYIDHGDDKWTQKTISTFKNFEINFKLGEPFEETTADGRKCDAVITREGDALIHKQHFGGEDAQVIRDFKADGQLVSTFKAKDVVATRVYKKV